VPAVRRQLKKVEGVVDAEVDLASATAKVTLVKGTAPDKVVGGLSGKYSGAVKKD
jgi:copper chaperone CopZ